MVRSHEAGLSLSMALAATTAWVAAASDSGIASSFGLSISDWELRSQLIQARDAGTKHAELALDSDAGRRLLQLEDISADSPSAAEVGVGFEGADSPIGTLLPPAVPEHNTTGAAFAPAEVGFGFEDAESPTGAPKDLMILNEGGDPRDGLRVAYYFDTEPGFWFTASEWAYLAFRVFPAATNVLRRSVRVREPGGNLMLGGLEDPDPFVSIIHKKNIPGDPVLGISADILLKVYDGDSNCDEGTIAGAGSLIGEEETLRPLYGFVQMCSLAPDGDVYKDIETIVHEIIHALGFGKLLVEFWKGYESLEDVEAIVPMKGDSFESRAIIKTPNVQRVAQEHFACATLLGGETEDFGGIGSGGGGFYLSGHWDSRIFNGELMNSATYSTDLHIHRQALTDITFAVLQDSGWYDVKYGSSGFNPYGYKAGCGFAEFDFATALLSPTAEQYLCNPTDNVLVKCNFEHSAPGYCVADPTQNGFIQANSFVPELLDGFPGAPEVEGCQSREGPFGERCIQPKGELPICAPMDCSADGQVTILGSPCDPAALDCPDDEFMCSDPGPLTCQGELNDCNGRGDCYKGSCYCHVGWGGADCSVSVCLSNEGCPDGSECPFSGFCGVPECGTWSSAALGEGVPCNGATGPAPTATLPVPLRGPQQPANETYLEMKFGSYDYDYLFLFDYDYSFASAPGPAVLLDPGSALFDYDYATAPA